MLGRPDIRGGAWGHLNEGGGAVYRQAAQCDAGSVIERQPWAIGGGEATKVMDYQKAQLAKRG
jgi:hypothetical protein